MQKSTQRRTLGVLAAVIASQALTACIVLPVPHRHRAVVVQPGYSGPPPYHHPHHRHWRR
jgi:hypothetical protein